MAFPQKNEADKPMVRRVPDVILERHDDISWHWPVARNVTLVRKNKNFMDVKSG